MMNKDEHETLARCGICAHVVIQEDRDGTEIFHCGRYPPTIINSSSYALFPKVMRAWHCGEFANKS